MSVIMPVRMHAERRNNIRYRLERPLLAVSEYYSGEIFDIGRNGLSFMIVHLYNESDPSPNRWESHYIDILDVRTQKENIHLVKGLRVEEAYDVYLGALHPDNRQILKFRRGVKLAGAMSDSQLERLLPYLAEGRERIQPGPREMTPAGQGLRR